MALYNDSVFVFGLVFGGRPFLCSPAWPGTHNPPTAAVPVLRLHMCTTMPNLQL